MADSNFQRPTLAELISRIESDFNTRLPGADSRVRRSVLSVLARVVAGVVHLLYGYLDFLARQLFLDTATGWFLERLAAIWGIFRQAATKATGTLTVTGTNGTAISAGKVLQRGDGVEYVTTSAATITGGTATVTIEAREAGVDGNSKSGTILTFTSPISGANAQGTTGSVTGGADVEDDESLRTRALERVRRPPHGGADFDYVTWAKEVPGVTRAWVYPKENGGGSVTVRFMMDGTYSDGIPQSGDVEMVQAYIESKRPVTAELFVEAPVAETLDFDILLLDPTGAVVTDPTVRDAVEAELLDLLQREAEPKADGVVNTQPSGKILISHIRQAVSNAAGEYDHDVQDPIADVTPDDTGKIFVMGEITWLTGES